MNLDSPRKRRPRGTAAIRNQLRETIRSEILDAAEELIASRGLHGAALVHIAKRAGVAVGTLYNYFADREALVKALFESRRATLRPQLVAAIHGSRGLTFEPRLRRYVHDLMGIYEANRRFLKVAIETEHLRMSMTPSTAATELTVAVHEIVTAGVREGAIAPEDPDILTLMIVGAMKSVVLRRVTNGASLIDAADQIVSVFLDGARVRDDARSAS